ncbi:MAG: T9SS type A sorting domain-containing protein [Bacteroidota bacterium]|nr:T9SS type A sorting domain-containing protein [Bacteroidota bacterium]
MYKLILLSTYLFFSFFSAFSQVGSDFQRDRFRMKERAENRSVMNQGELQQQRYGLKIGEREILIQTTDGTAPAEKHLEVIKNVLTEDFLVNDDTTGGTPLQHSPSIAMNASGNCVIVWVDERNGNYDIYFQRYNSSGAAQGINTKVNDYAGNSSNANPFISMDGSGNFVVVWNDYRNGNYDIYSQRYNSSGAAQGVNTKANDDAGTAEQYSPSIAMDGSGNFVVVWEDYRNNDVDIYCQRYNSSGTAQGINFNVNDDAGTAYNPSIAVDGSGNFVIVWGDYRNNDVDIYCQRYNSSGTAQGVNFKVNDDAGTAYQDYPSIAMDGSGNFVVVWYDYRNGNWDIYSQRYNSAGAAQGENFKVNDDAGTVYPYYSPSVAMDVSGNFVIVWQDERNGNTDIYCQRYNSSGAAQGVNFKVNDDAGTAHQWYPSIAVNGSGDFVIVWEDYRNGDYNPDIYYQKYNSSGIAQGVNTKVNDDVGTASQGSPSIAMDGSGNFVIVWRDARNGNEDIYSQRYNSSGAAQGVNTKVNDDVGTAIQRYPSIAIDGSGNFVIVWQDERNGNSDTYYQRYNFKGIAQGANTNANDDAGTAGQLHPSVAMDGSGDFVIVWEDYRNGNYDIYYQRYDSSGAAMGINTKVNDDVGTASQISPFVSMSGSGNFNVVWLDFRNGGHIYLQRYDSTGLPQGTNLKVDDDIRADRWDPSISMDGNGNTVIVWIDRRNGHPDIYLQRYDSTGVAQGVNTKVNDDEGWVGQYNPSIAMDGSGNFVIVWIDYRYGFNNPDVIGQRYYANGTTWGTNYRVVADGPNQYEGVPVVAANAFQIVFSWMDNRRSKGYDIFAKIVGWDWEGVTSVLSEKNIPTDVALLQNYPNPFNPSTKIKFAIPEGVETRHGVSLRVYDVLGREVAVLVDEYKEAGYYEVSFDASQFTSGVYFYRLQSGNFNSVKKMLLLR